jgi:hypothetical protein
VLPLDAPVQELGREGGGGHLAATLSDAPGHGAIAGYPNVNAYASAPGSRNVISSVRSRTASC